jgi:hypothetical protein
VVQIPDQSCRLDAGWRGELLELFPPCCRLEIKAIADDAFEDEVVGRAGKSPAEAEIDFLLRGEVQVNGGEYLLLLLVDWEEVGGRAE